MSHTRMLVAACLAAATVPGPAGAAPRPAPPAIVDSNGRPVDAATLARLGYTSVSYTLPTGIWEWESLGRAWSTLGVTQGPPEAAISGFIIDANDPNDFVLTFTTTTTLTQGWCDNSPTFGVSGRPADTSGLDVLDGTLVTGTSCSVVSPAFPLAQWSVAISGGDLWSRDGSTRLYGPFGGTFSH